MSWCLPHASELYDVSWEEGRKGGDVCPDYIRTASFTSKLIPLAWHHDPLPDMPFESDSTLLKRLKRTGKGRFSFQS